LKEIGERWTVSSEKVYGEEKLPDEEEIILVSGCQYQESFSLRGLRKGCLHRGRSGDQSAKVRPVGRPCENQKEYQILHFIGNNSIISESCFISACNRVVIEENVGVSPNVMIIDNSRKLGDVSRPSKEQELKIGYVHIGADSWIAYGACVMPNVTIGKHCIIGALSVVNKDIPPYSVAVGSPARVVKRFDFDRREWVKVNG
jgi:acetyltransferase-like isoleucine patch superfamily enzyme